MPSLTILLKLPGSLLDSDPLLPPQKWSLSWILCFSFLLLHAQAICCLVWHIFNFIYMVSSIFYSLLFHLTLILKFIHVDACSCSSFIFTAEFHCINMPGFIHAFACQWTSWVVSSVLPLQAMLLWAYFYMSYFYTEISKFSEISSHPRQMITHYCFHLHFPDYWRGGTSYIYTH